MVPFYKRKKMEIFKLFNEWPKSPEKETKTKITKCECSKLKKEISEKDCIIKGQAAKMDETDSQLRKITDQNTGLLSNIANLEEDKTTLKEKDVAQGNEIIQLKLERDKYKHEAEIQAGHLKNVEFSFNDVHCKYERAKALIEDLRVNENNLQSCIRLHEETIQLLIEQYSALKNYSLQQFHDANIHVNKINQERESVISHLQSKVRKLEITTAALEQNLQQKIVENEQLSTVCDELINKQSTYYIHNVQDVIQTK